MSRLVALLLVVLTCATSLAAGIARGQPGPVGQIVICTGAGPVMVHLDANGDPSGPPVLCPDGVAALFNLAVLKSADAAPVRREIGLVHAVQVPAPARVLPVDVRARSPPPRAA